MANPSDIYTAEWYRGHYQLRAEYRRLADAIADVPLVDPAAVLDVGCGVGFILERLAELGHPIVGVDGSSHAIECAPEGIRDRLHYYDIRHDPLLNVSASLVICTEVAEHLQAQYADRLVDLLCHCALGPIFFTAATPGQGGHDHVNEQEPIYWYEKFRVRGKVYDQDASWAIRERCKADCPGMPWFARTSMVFR